MDFSEKNRKSKLKKAISRDIFRKWGTLLEKISKDVYYPESWYCQNPNIQQGALFYVEEENAPIS